MAFDFPGSGGRYTFDAQADGDAAAFSWTDNIGTTTTLANNNTQGRWCWHNASTTSSNVGPDNGQGGSPDGYAYTEMSGQTSGDIFDCEFGTTVDTTTQTLLVDFYYCMRGDAVRATLDVQTKEGTGSWVTQFTTGFGDDTIPGTSGATTWHNKVYDITANGANPPSHATTAIRFRLTNTADPTSQMWHNDNALDGIRIYGNDLGPAITDIDTDEDVYDGQTGVVITGTTFETDGANSRVRLNSASTGLGTDVVQTDTSWADTSIQFTVSKGALSFGTVYAFVRNQSLQENAVGFQINLHDFLNITNVAPAILRSGDTGIVISGEGFGTSQGTGRIELTDVTTDVSQTVTSWASDTSLTFTAVQGALDEDDPIFVKVVRNQSGQGDSSERESNSFSVDLLPPLAFVLSASTQFADDDPTTRQLTELPGQDFQAGSIQESSTPPDVELAGRGYTEYEFCIQATVDAAAGQQYEFRVVDDSQSGEQLEEYNVVPKVTIAP